MRDTYHRVYRRIWDEPWTEDERYFALYLLTGQHRTFEGIYKLPLMYAAGDLGWNLARVKKCMRGLEGHGFVKYDDAAQVVWIIKALKAQSPNENQCRAAVRKIADLPRPKFYDDFLTVSRNLCPKLGEAFDELSLAGGRS